MNMRKTLFTISALMCATENLRQKRLPPTPDGLPPPVTSTLDILGVADSGIYITQAEDMKTGSVNNLLTPGRNLKITGQKIKIAGPDPTVGVLFRSQDDP